jgi:DNA replication protein DnaC
MVVTDLLLNPHTLLSATNIPAMAHERLRARSNSEGEKLDTEDDTIVTTLESTEDDDAANSDEDSDDESKRSRRPYSVSEKRMAQNIVFDNYVVKKAKSICKAIRKDEVASAEDEQLTIDSMLAKGQTETIKDPREYQVELFERAKKENIIAVLDTGSGKTLIAVLLLKHILDKELEDRAANLAPRISFFLVRYSTTDFTGILNICRSHPLR